MIVPAAITGKIYPADRMSSRERLMSAYKGLEVDRIPYWVKVNTSSWKSSQPREISNMSAWELLDYIGADGLFHSPAPVDVNRPHVTCDRVTIADGSVSTHTTHTPDGDLVARWANDPNTNSSHPVEFPVKTQEDIKRLRWVYTDVKYPLNSENLETAKAFQDQLSQRGVTICSIGPSPLMDLVEHLIGPVNTTYMLMDYPDAMGELIELMSRARLDHLAAGAKYSCADIIASTENTSTTLISPAQFERYCYRHLCESGRIVEGEGKMHELHMCGHLLALLEKIDTIPAASIEAYTSPTLGNTRLVDGRTKAPTKTLVGGTNAMVWLMDVEAIEDYLRTELDACPDHRRIVLTTAGVAPPACPAEKFRAVGQWLARQPVRV